MDTSSRVRLLNLGSANTLKARSNLSQPNKFPRKLQRNPRKADAMSTPPIKPEEIPTLLAELTQSRFWGSLQIDFQNGEPILLRKSETRKFVTPSTYEGKAHDRNRR